MPFDACCVGRDVDEGIRYCADCVDVSDCGATLVERATLPCQLDESEYTIYRVGSGDSAAWGFVAALGGEDSERLQDMPASGETDDAVGNAVQHCDRERGVKKAT